MNTNGYDYAKEQKEAMIQNTCYATGLDEQTVRDFAKRLKDVTPIVLGTAESVGNALRLLQEVVQEGCYNISRLAELQQVVVDKAKEIAELEHRKKHCKNYLELKQIDKRLNVLKFKQSKRRNRT